MTAGRFCITVFSLVVLMCVTAQADQVYRWVDAQGHVHYSQTPPPNAATRTRLMDVEPAPVDVTAAQQQQALVKSVQAADANRQKAAAAAEQQAQKKARKEQLCRQARQRLQGYMEAHRVITHGNSANPTYYTGENLVKFRQRAQQQVNKLCGES